MPRKNEPHKPETVELIRTKVTAAHQRAREAAVDVVREKRCTACGEWKPCLPGEAFSMRKRRLADGTVNVYPAGECKRCASKRAAKHREGLGREEMRKREVQYQRTYRTKLKQRERLPLEPIAVFLEERVHRHGMSAIETATGIDHKILGDVIDRTYKSISLRKVDRILVGLNCVDQLHILYPQEGGT